MALAAGATLRLTRLIVADDLGQWWVKDPIDRAAERWWEHQCEVYGDYTPPQPWWWKYRSGLDCPFCVGFWIAVGALGSAALAGRSRSWRFAAGALTLNYVAAHLGSRLGDTNEESSDDDN